MVDIKNKLEDYEKLKLKVKSKLEICRILLMNNINYYDSDEIIQLNNFFESIELLLEEEYKDLGNDGEFVKYLKINKYIEPLKEIEEVLNMFEINLNSKKTENIKK